MSSEKTKTNDWLIDRLIDLCSDKHRGSRAELKRYWSPGTRHYAYPHLAKLGVLRRTNKSDEIIAGLFAEHPEHELGGRRFGQAALKLAGGSSKAPEFESFEKHFRRLLACDGYDFGDLAGQLHRIVKRMNRGSIVFDYNSLLWDLRNWPSKSDDVKIRWSRDFWQSPYEIKLSEGVG